MGLFLRKITAKSAGLQQQTEPIQTKLNDEYQRVIKKRPFFYQKIKGSRFSPLFYSVF